MKSVKAKILYAEDDRIDQMVFEQYVKNQGLLYNYKIAGSVREATQILKSELFDVVITDYNLGDGNAFELFPYVSNNAPIIFVTSANDLNLAVTAMKSGAYDFLVKDLNRTYLDFLPLTVKKAVDHKKKEEQLRIAENEIKRLSSALARTNNSILITDPFGKIVWVNEGFEKITGYSFEDVKGTFAEILKKDGKTNSSLISEIYQSFTKDKKSVIYETKNFTKEGAEYWTLSSITPILNEKGELDELVVIDSDISQRKKTEEALIRANLIAEDSLKKMNKAFDELTKAKKQVEELMKIKEHFFLNMSHEIRTPLNAIIGFADLMQRTPLSPEQKRYNNALKTSGENLLVIINDILDFSKIKSGKISFEEISFKLSQVVSTATEILLEKSIAKGIRFSKIIDPAIPDHLIGDPTRLNQILLNLLGNAIKFTEKGEVKTVVSVVADYEESILLQFSVIDTGIGIPENKLDSIFEEFTQASNDTTRKYGGSGLGLTIVKQLVEMQGGQISVKSEIGKGTTFTFTLKYKKNIHYINESNGKEKKTTEHETPALGDSLHILVVEDNLLNQILVEKYLKDWKCNVELAENGVIAIQKLEKQYFDILLMDIQLPEMDGYETTLYIRQQMPPPTCSIPIIAMTAHAIHSEEEKCISVGMNGYISKPFKWEVLKGKIVHLVNQKKTAT